MYRVLGYCTLWWSNDVTATLVLNEFKKIFGNSECTLPTSIWSNTDTSVIQSINSIYLSECKYQPFPFRFVQCQKLECLVNIRKKDQCCNVHTTSLQLSNHWSTDQINTRECVTLLTQTQDHKILLRAACRGAHKSQASVSALVFMRMKTGWKWFSILSTCC